jgi:hypothetical protein
MEPLQNLVMEKLTEFRSLREFPRYMVTNLEGIQQDYTAEPTPKIGSCHLRCVLHCPSFRFRDV